MKELTKGSVVFIHGIWYVVVNIMVQDDFSIKLNCICDHANNRYSCRLEDTALILSAKKAIHISSYGTSDDKINDIVYERAIPIDVIAEVLTNAHDDRFYDWADE